MYFFQDLKCCLETKALILKNISRIYVEKHYVRYITIFSWCLNISAIGGATVHRHAFAVFVPGMWMPAILDRKKHARTSNLFTIQLCY